MRPLSFIGLATLLFLMVSCGAEGVEDSPEGTGSAGGNPLNFSFDVEDSEELADVTWRAPLLHLGDVRLYRLSESGQCTFSKTLPLGITYRFPAFYQEVPITRPWPCALELYPKTGDALLEVPALLQRNVTFRFFRDAGIRVDIPNPERFDLSRDIFVVLRLDRLLDGLDWSSVESLLLNQGLREKLIDNLLRAFVIYLDPSPGDGELRLDERTEDNILARFSLLGERDVELIP